MDDYTESELYAIFANIGYEINKGKTLEEIEQEIKQDYGLDIELDKELSDKFGAIIKYRDEIIHSVRGTDFWTSDVLVDLNLMTDHPYYSPVISTFFSVLGSHKISKALLNYNTGNFDDPNYYTDLVRRFINEYYETKDFEEEEIDLEAGYVSVFDPDLTDDDAMEDILEFLNPDIRRNMKNKYEMKTYVASMIALLTIPSVIKKSIDYYIGITFRDKRVNREFKRFDEAKAKYSNLKMSLTGHSLGAIANDIGRTHNVKSITFNPAPMDHNKKQPHKDSKIYRINHDFVSAFLTENDTEPITTTNKYPWYTNFDFLTEQAVDYITPKSLEPIKPFLKDYLSPGKLGFLKIHDIDNFLPTKKKTKNDKPTTVVKQSQRHLLLTHKHKNENYDQLLKRYSHRPIVKLLRVYSGIFEDSIEEFLPNYQRQDLSYTNKLKFKQKLKKKIYI